MRISRPALHTETLVLLAALWLLAACNAPFWHSILAGRDPHAPGTWAFMAALFTAFAAAYTGFALLLATRWTVRPLLAILLVTGACVSFYMERYSVYFDRTMFANVIATNWGEARELLSIEFVRHVLLLGVLPAVALWWPRLLSRRPLRAAAVRTGWITGAAIMVVASLLPVFADFASAMRNQREVRHLLAPGNVVAASASYYFGRASRPAGPLAVVGQDARTVATPDRRPTLFVLVVGETARAQNFSLNGYDRLTNPELAKRDIVNFRNATSCGTSTEVSLPCMFSPYGRENYDERAILSHESVLHVLHRAGVQVLWRDNQSGCKGVCAGLPAEQMDHAAVEGLCPEGQCYDEVLLHGLDRVVRDAHGNLLVVLHQLGSHGPAYYRRYPAAFRRFAPACEQDELRRCTPAEIVNAYDNSLLYTDYFLAQLIDFLKTQSGRYDTAMLYMSDHGESLGESGLYLHGMPYPIAPDVQKHVPMVAWFSPGFASASHLDVGCLRSRAAQPVSHDNLFHTLLGVMQVQASVYQPDKDILVPCRAVTARNAQ
ncbi:phosphoethanolamine transferase [Ramlibacter humi]|uniref:Phosphoethanolamine--lipid A transferase n=1 Tax=Ramlibacter humi TaxID=2530451 RepID=A0A4Z0CC99_9BURK|nr:phosphoethanolamine--lipid A transferase [Ramlibacter humi]TFZ08664.1 phosphoethanolamine--lipid A transferase [Ramlibacter humi]